MDVTMVFLLVLFLLSLVVNAVMYLKMMDVFERYRCKCSQLSETKDNLREQRQIVDNMILRLKEFYPNVLLESHFSAFMGINFVSILPPDYYTVTGKKWKMLSKELKKITELTYDGEKIPVEIKVGKHGKS